MVNTNTDLRRPTRPGRELTGADQVREMRRSLGRELAARRREAGFSQRQLAPLTGYARSTVSDAELGRHHVRRDFWERCQRVLRVDGELTRRYDQIEAVAAAWRAAAIRAAQTAREERAAVWPAMPPTKSAHGVNRVNDANNLNGGYDANGTSGGIGMNHGNGASGGTHGNGVIPVPANVVTVQQCPACHHPLAVITMLAAPPQ
jgi:transcriptional regulator with XRE-family HTH domain